MHTGFMSVCVPGMHGGLFPHRVGPQSVAGGTGDLIDFGVTEQDRLTVPMCWPQPVPRGTDPASDGVIHPGLAFSPAASANGVGLSVKPVFCAGCERVGGRAPKGITRLQPEKKHPAGCDSLSARGLGSKTWLTQVSGHSRSGHRQEPASSPDSPSGSRRFGLACLN